ncbi:MAG: RluA family pseudouridine synthase [Gammaproteobacteria bacterium]|nr:RluA family pseudouridine synthase [Gammaproteobacteria bacterium]
MSQVLPSHIPATYRGQRLDATLASLCPEFSRTQLSAGLKSGTILVNGEITQPKTKVLGEEQLTFQQDAFLPVYPMEALPESIPLDICYEDDDILVINKPVGLVVHPGAGNPTHTLVNALLFHDPALQALPRAGIIHRLDKHTTGLLLVAKNKASYHVLTNTMRERHIKRYYLALVQGRIVTPNTINTAFGRDPRNRLKMAVRREGKEAITRYQPIQHFHRFTLLQVELLTGRTHQIRVHMAHIKHPIVGDPLYGSPPPLPFETPQFIRDAFNAFKRQALHAHKLCFAHPITHKPIELEAPLPADFTDLLTLLESQNASFS